VRPPSVDLLTSTAAPRTSAVGASEETIQTLCRASYAVTGLVVRANVPPPIGGWFVCPGSGPEAASVVPLFVSVANPVPDAPPSKKRPICAVTTSVEPNANVSGSTAVAC